MCSLVMIDVLHAAYLFFASPGGKKVIKRHLNNWIYIKMNSITAFFFKLQLHAVHNQKADTNEQLFIFSHMNNCYL